MRHEKREALPDRSVGSPSAVFCLRYSVPPTHYAYTYDRPSLFDRRARIELCLASRVCILTRKEVVEILLHLKIYTVLGQDDKTMFILSLF